MAPAPLPLPALSPEPALGELEDPFAKDPFFTSSPPNPSNAGATSASDAATLVRPAPGPAPEVAPPPAPRAESMPGAPAPEVIDDIDEDALLGRRKKGSGLHPAAWALIAAGAVFGGVAAFMLLKRPEPQGPQIVYVSASAPAPSAPAAPGTATEAAPVEDPAVQADPTKPKLTGRLPVGAPTGTTTGKPAASLDMSGFQSPNVAGPSATGPGAAGGSAGGQLSAGEISAVVEQNRPLVRRRCWQPALESNKGFGGSARVSASITIAPSGAVQSVSASGAEKDYPGLSSCIAARIKGWKFPPSGGSTPVNIPFVFAAQ